MEKMDDIKLPPEKQTVQVNKQALEKKINSERKYHYRWASIDFTIAQTIVLVSILASFAAAILIGIDGDGIKWGIAACAAIPGTAIVIERNISFYRRSVWHVDFGLKLEMLLAKLQVGEIEPSEAKIAFVALKQEMEEIFPPMEVPLTNQSSKNDPKRSI